MACAALSENTRRDVATGLPPLHRGASDGDRAFLVALIRHGGRRADRRRSRLEASTGSVDGATAATIPRATTPRDAGWAICPRVLPIDAAFVTCPRGNNWRQLSQMAQLHVA